jgi:eukaryotic-like serine/threonine-protein kinase
MFKFITHRPLWLNVVIGIALAIGLFSLGLLSLDWITGHGKSASVPSVKGKNFKEAATILQRSGFRVEILDSVYSDTTKPMEVLKQIPEADEIVKTNRTILLVIGRVVPPMIDMPNLNGYSLRNALSVLKNLDLRLGDTTFRPDFAKNAVLEQLHKGSVIAPGTRIPKGSTISFVLGDGVGDKQFAVPSVVGVSFAEAKEFLKEKGIGIGAIVLDPGVKDTMEAWIYRQNPPRFDENHTMLFMHSGQTMDVWLTSNKEAADTLMKKEIKIQKGSAKELEEKEAADKKKNEAKAAAKKPEND